MGQVVSLVVAKDEFPPLAVGRNTAFIFDHPITGLYIVNGIVADINDTHVIVDDRTNEKVRRLSVAHESILERFE